MFLRGNEKNIMWLPPLIWRYGCDHAKSRARDKGSYIIQVKYPYVLSIYSIIFKNLGIDTQLISQSTQLFPMSGVKIKVSRPGKHMIAILYYDYCR